MTEKEFWKFLETAWETKGRVPQVSGSIDNPDPQIQAGGEYLQGHALLPRDYDKISEKEIIKMGNLLFDKGVMLKTKEAVMMILAHQTLKTALSILKKYNAAPDEKLRFFAQMALDESEMWND